MNNYFIILASGQSKRFNSKKLKQFSIYKNKALFKHSLEKAMKSKLFKKIILVVNNKKSIKEKFPKNVSIIKGGKERSDSSLIALKYIKKFKPNNVLIHDAARPFLNIKVLENLISSIKNQPENNGYVVAEKVNSTIKKIKNMHIEKTISRDDIWLAQTPQAFKFKDMIKIYGKIDNLDKYTDDSSIMENHNIYPALIHNCHVCAHT